jgi:hypothetical protein
VLALLAGFAYWLAHPPTDRSGYTPFTRYDEILIVCETPAWWWVLVALVLAAYVAGPILVVVGAVREYRRRDWSGAALGILGVAAVACALCATSLALDIVSVDCN